MQAATCEYFINQSDNCFVGDHFLLVITFIAIILSPHCLLVTATWDISTWWLIFNITPHRYESVVIGNGLANQVSNPDVDVDITKPDIVIRSQIAALKEMTSWLKAAHSGNDISIDNGKGPYSSSPWLSLVT